MQVEYRLKLGQEEFLLKVDVNNVLEFFEKLSFYSNIPKVGPNGETDLKISHRTTTQGYNYYSLVSEQAGMEYRFGQPKEDPKILFPKGWQPIFKGEGEQTQAPAQNLAPRQTPGVPAQAPTQNLAPQTPAVPAFNPGVAATPAQLAPTMPSPSFPAQQAPIAPPAQVNTPPTQGLSPAAQQKANNVLNRFGLAPKV